MTSLELKQVSKRFGSVEAIRGIDLAIGSGELCVLVGPSGCGKSTVLRMIAGLEDITSGEVLIDGRMVNGLAPIERGLAMVFQSYALYPHMSVEGNMSFGLRMTGTPRREVRRRVEAAAAVLQLMPLLKRLPAQLSGGQRQRVAIGRAIVRDPRAFLFDEPLSNLDAELRVQMRMEIARLHAELGATMIFVTHDQVEAMTLADRIVVLREGRVEQIGTPQELFDSPANLFVAGFMGSPRMNLLRGRVGSVEGQLELEGVGVLPVSVPLTAGQTVMAGIRPSDVREEAGPGLGIELVAGIVEDLGASRIVHGRTPQGVEMTFELRKKRPTTGERVKVWLEPGLFHLFDPQGPRLKVGASVGRG
jgi:lactose/L-arabinose transport system ATP-binding protein